MTHAVVSYYPIRERRGWFRLSSSFSVLGVGFLGGNEDGKGKEATLGDNRLDRR